MREKLIELLSESIRHAGNVCGETGDCKKCQYDKYGEDCGYAIRADYFIANGVTIATDNNKWIPVTERLPDTAERVLVCKTWNGRVYKPEYGYYQDFPNQKGCWYVLTEEGYYPQREVTHWMPLPEPPKGE